MIEIKIGFSGFRLTTQIGGAEISSAQLIEDLRSPGVKSTIFTTRKGPYPIKNSSIIYLPNYQISPLEMRGNILLDWSYSRIIKRWVQKQKLELIHSTDQAMIAGSERVASKLSLPIVSTVRFYRFVCVSDYYCRLVGLDGTNDYTRCRNSQFLQNCLNQLYPAPKDKWKVLYKRFIKKRALEVRNALKKSTAIVAVSEFVKKILIEFGFEQEKIQVIYNPPITLEVNDAMFSRQYKYLEILKKDYRLLIYSGRLTPGKGCIDIVRAMVYVKEVIPKIKLLIFGEGVERAKILAMIKNLDLVNEVTLLGFRPQNEIQYVLKFMDLILLPSKWAEAFSRSIIDAAIHGIPLVGTYNGGIIEYGEFGAALLAQTNNPRSLAEKIIKILTSDSLYLKLKKKALEFASVHLTNKKGAKAHYQLYQDVIIS